MHIISVAARITGMHPQTLRTYDRAGLVTPQRTAGQDRRYSDRDLGRLRRIRDLARNGINLIGIKMILDLEDQLAQLRLRTGQSPKENNTGKLSDRTAPTDTVPPGSTVPPDSTAPPDSTNPPGNMRTECSETIFVSGPNIVQEDQ